MKLLVVRRQPGRWLGAHDQRGTMAKRGPWPNGVHGQRGPMAKGGQKNVLYIILTVEQ